jgi:hypothetical protein
MKLARRIVFIILTIVALCGFAFGAMHLILLAEFNCWAGNGPPVADAETYRAAGRFFWGLALVCLAGCVVMGTVLLRLLCGKVGK